MRRPFIQAPELLTYWGCTDDYGRNISSPANFGVLRGLLGAIQGRFIMSINDTPEVREIFAGFTIAEVGLNYQIGRKVTPARELIISGPWPSGVL